MDDVLLAGSLDSDIIHAKSFLHSAFTIKDMGLAIYFLGVELLRTSIGLHLHQCKYILSLLNDAGLMGSRSVTTPLPKGYKFVADLGPLLEDPAQYRRLVGYLLYLNLILLFCSLRPFYFSKINNSHLN